MINHRKIMEYVSHTSSVGNEYIVNKSVENYGDSCLYMITNLLGHNL